NLQHVSDGRRRGVHFHSRPSQALHLGESFVANRGIDDSSSLGHQHSVGKLQYPQRGYDRAIAPAYSVSHLRRVGLHGHVDEPRECNRSVKDEPVQRRPSSIRSFVVTPGWGLAFLRIFSMAANISSRSLSLLAGPITAASFPRFVIPICSPRPARSTSSESFCFASNSPTLRISRLSTNNLDE